MEDVIALAFLRLMRRSRCSLLVSDVEPRAGRVGKHVEHVEGLFTFKVLGFVGLVFGPASRHFGSIAGNRSLYSESPFFEIKSVVCGVNAGARRIGLPFGELTDARRAALKRTPAPLF